MITIETNGAKAFRLDELRQAGVRVPAFLSLSTNDFAETLQANNIDLKNTDSQELSAKITNAKIPDAISDQIGKQLGLLFKENTTLFSVRSSAVAEDSAAASFAGQFHTELLVKYSELDIWQAVKKVWASQFSQRVVTYFDAHQINWRRPMMGVIIQQMVLAKWSGVLFTRNPVTGDQSQRMLEFVEGLGEQLVSGEAIPQQIVWQPGQKIKMPSGINFSPDLLAQLDRTAGTIEKIYGVPQDIEWAYDGAELYVLQTRPITAMAEPQVVIEWTDENVGEVIPDIVTPLTWSMLGDITNNAFYYFLNQVGIRQKNKSKLFEVFWGKVYFNSTEFNKILSQFYLEHTLKNIRESKSKLLKLIPAFYQIIKTMTYSGWLILNLPAKNDRFIKSHASRLQNIKNQPDLETINRLLNLHQKTMNLHVTVTFLGEIFFQALKSFVNKWGLTEKGVYAEKLVQGIQSVESSQSGFQLWKLAGEYSRNSIIVELLESGEPGQFLDRLCQADPDAAVKFDEYLKQYGHGALHEFELIYPRWAEDPAFLVANLKSYMDSVQNDVSYMPDAPSAKEERLQNYKTAMQSLGLVKRAVFKFILSRTHKFMRQRESLKQAFLKGHLKVKLNVNELARKFIDQKIIAGQEQIFYLKVDEISEILHGKISYNISGKLEKRIRQRNENLNREHPQKFRQAGEKFIFEQNANELETENVIKGIACSSGKITGTARIIRRPEEFGNLKSGDILIAPSTNPGWTPLFVLASAVVTEIGGALSHGAIIAREYGIPMVTAVPGIIGKIKDGMRVEVDGTNGYVNIQEN